MKNASETSKQRTRRAKNFDLDVVGRLDCVTAPKQARSERSLQRVLSALEALLESKTYVEISIPEIAARSECSAATIYGRFKDKHSILAALHESLRERMFAELSQLLEPTRWDQRDLDELTDEFCTKLVSFYRRDWNLMAAVMVSADAEIFHRASENIQHAKECFGSAARHLEGGSLRVNNQAVEMGVSAVFALLQQRLLFGAEGPISKAGRSDALFAKELATLLRVCVRSEP